MSSGSPESKPSFVDLFAGCGGLSLGLLKAGWSGVLAIEKDPLAFKTIEHNLIGPETCPKYDWPPWFPKEPHTVADFNTRYAQQMQALRGRISLVIGGPLAKDFHWRADGNAKTNGIPCSKIFSTPSQPFRPHW